MSPREWLETIRARGAIVTVESRDRIVIEPDVLTDAEAAELAQVKPALLALLRSSAPGHHVTAFEAVLTRMAELAVAAADDEHVDPGELVQLRQERSRLISEVGPAYAEALEGEVLRAFRSETARCGRCGGLGHDGGCSQ
jgi:hypothetical protein